MNNETRIHQKLPKINLSKYRLYYEFNYIKEFKTGEMEDQILVFLGIYWHKIS